MAEYGHAVVYFVGLKPVANFHKDKSVATLAWIEDGDQREVVVLPCPHEEDGDVLLALWASLYQLDISSLAEMPPTSHSE